LHSVVFFKSAGGNEPGRGFIQELPPEDRRVVGYDLRTVQDGFPIGMPVCRPLGDHLYEVRSSLPSLREARLLFFIDGSFLVVVSGFIKKSQRTPPGELDLARARRAEFLENHGKNKR
jgi:phage-related protein